MHLVTSLQSVIKQGLEDIIYDHTIDGKCSQCGGCCSNLLPISKKEILAIRQYINKNDIKECRHLLPLSAAAYDMTCPFLDIGKGKEKCRIYAVRPEICKQFICNNEQRAKNNQDKLNLGRTIVNVRDLFFGQQHIPFLKK